MKKIFLFFFVFFGVLIFELFLLKIHANYIPQFQIEYFPYDEQESFQWIQNNFYFYKKRVYPLDPNYYYTFPFPPLGYIRYKKVGDEIEYYISENQLFWKRKLTSYPYFEPYGKLIFAINADRTTLTVLDINGNILKEISGIFLVDLNCSYFHTKFYCFSLFSDGKFDVFNEMESYTINLNKGESYFKSFSIQDKEIAFHYYRNETDFFEIYRFDIQDSKIILNSINLIQSQILFPYTISFHFNNDLVIFPNFQETIIIKEKIYKFNPIINTDNNPYEIVKHQNEVTIDITFLGESKYYRQLIFIMKTKTLEIYDQNGNFLFYWDLLDTTNLIHIKDNLFIFLNNGFISLKFI